jgi:uncharacterized lipoprotein YbaY/membrane-bound inhibitor of C-type lysozyme
MIRILSGAAGVTFGCLALWLPAQPALADAAMRAVTGSLTYVERIALPETAEVVLEFRGRDGRVLASDRAATDGRQVPIDLRLWVRAERAGDIVGAVAIDGTTAWRTDPVPVPAGTGPVDLGEVRLARMAAMPEPAQEPEPAPAPVPEPEVAEPEVAEPEVAAPAVPEPEPEVVPEPEPEPAAPEAREVALMCGDTEVRATLGEGRADVVVGGVSIAMVQVPAASGARFEVPDDPDTFLWDRGDRALVGLAGEVLPECERAAD